MRGLRNRLSPGNRRWLATFAVFNHRSEGSPCPPALFHSYFFTASRCPNAPGPLWCRSWHPITRSSAPTTLGHRDGPPAVLRPARCANLVDHAERDLDARGLDQVNIAGNSLGGWMAIELARRGRAVTVCALSPAGFWDSDSASHSDSTAKIARGPALAKLARSVTPLAVRLSLIRRVVLRDIATRADRTTPAAAVDIARDLLECTVTTDPLSTDETISMLGLCRARSRWPGPNTIGYSRPR
nr:alpha/beta fold hydrolase [Nocardia rhizosphaerihabitans]